jgi:glycosyltransferase involved in cell wall biosynthesis
MRVTVAICTWNRCELLRQTLEQLTHVAVPHGIDWELLVVNNNCTDATDVVIASFAGRLPLRGITEPRQGLSNARNRALSEAAGEYILWIDDDVLVDEQWLAGFAEAARRHPEAAVIGGLVEPWFPAEPDPLLSAAFPALRRGFCGVDHGSVERVLGAEEHVFGANMAFRASVLRDLHFDPELGRRGAMQLGGEELEIQNQIRARGGRVVWCPSMQVRHYVDPSRMTLRYLLEFYWFVGFHEIRLRGVPPGARVLGVPRWLFRVYAESRVHQWLYRLTGNKVSRLESLRVQTVLGGMIRGSWDAASRQR